ncbi:MAG TPA: HPP family protein [Candidatus Lokiarchaeia archaeon]|nr:HPP family protein [Candidatus Lokiarchaeia archaeon]
MVNSTLSNSIRITILVLIPAIAAWITGLQMIFPSLGPSAFILFTQDKKAFTPRRVIGGHFMGVLGGLASHYLLSSTLTLGKFPALLSLDAFRLVMSGVMAIFITSVGMLLTKTVHPPACATTLIVALGLLSTPLNALLIMISVCLMYGTYKLLLRTMKEPGSKSGQTTGISNENSIPAST